MKTVSRGEDMDGPTHGVGDASHAERVLIVDDEGLIRWALGQALSSKHCVVTEVVDASAALHAIRASRFDVVVLDYRLPGTVHLGLLREIRRLAPMSRIVMMTAFGTPEMIEEAVELGVSRVLEKPIDLDVATMAILGR